MQYGTINYHLTPMWHDLLTLGVVHLVWYDILSFGINMVRFVIISDSSKIMDFPLQNYRMTFTKITKT